jgi:Skp family chaperone for outer membrane proteins
MTLRSAFTTPGALSLFVLCAGVVACEKTADGVKQDTAEVAEAVNEKGARAQHELDAEMQDFKARTQSKLDELSVSISALQAKAEDGLDKSKTELQAQIEETKSELSKLQASSEVELERAKSKLDARLADFGKRVNGALDEVGTDLDTAGDKVEKKLE